MRGALGWGVQAVVVMVCWGLPAAAAEPGFPSFDPQAEVSVLTAAAEGGEVFTRGRWELDASHLALLEHLPGKESLWLPQGQQAHLGDGFVRLRLAAKRRVAGTLLLRGRLEVPGDWETLSGYGLVVRRGRAKLARWDRGVARVMGDSLRVRGLARLKSLEVALWAVGPHITAQLYDGKTFKLLATLSVSDSTHPAGQVGFRLLNAKPGSVQVQGLWVRPAGQPASGRRVPVGPTRFLELPAAALAGLPGELRRELREAERRGSEQAPMVVVRANARAHERIRRRGLQPTWLDVDTPHAWLDADYRRQQHRPLTRSPRGFRLDLSYKDPRMVEDLLRGYHARYPRQTELVQLGRTAADRPILALRMHRPSKRGPGIPVLLAGAHHGCELLSTDFVLDAVAGLLEGQRGDPEVRRWLRELDIWAVPLVSPDGNWSFLHRSKYAGRKNMRDLDRDGSFHPDDGVDLNRNYPFAWGTLGERGSHGRARSPYYRGPGPASERETQAMMRLADSERFAAAISFHTANTSILAPYTIEGVPDPEPNEALEIARALAEQMPEQPNGRSFRALRSIYPVDGTDQDWLRAAHGTVALLVEGALHNPRAAKLRRATVEATRPAWQGLLRRCVQGPTIAGRVVDAEGRPLLAEVQVVEQRRPGGERWFSRCRDGRFFRLLAKPGRYTVRAEAPGFGPTTRRVWAGAGQVARVELVLEPRPSLSVGEAAAAGPCASGLCSRDALCALRAARCPQPGTARWCVIDDRCHQSGAADPTHGRCVPERDPTGWSVAGAEDERPTRGSQ